MEKDASGEDQQGMDRSSSKRRSSCVDSKMHTRKEKEQDHEHRKSRTRHRYQRRHRRRSNSI